jgi:hypothetical protein
MDKSKFIKGADFDGEGLVLEFVRSEVFTPMDAKFGASHNYGPGGVITKENYLVKNGKLKEGESFKYYFKDGEQEREFDSNSVGSYFAFSKADLKGGEKLHIKRNKVSNMDVKWDIKKV